MVSRKFVKNKEDFICKHCGREVVGNGYTNHCPECLWSMHVDIYPGDRASTCGGMMKPVGGEKDGKEFVLIGKCEKCGYEKRNKLSNEDNFDVFVLLSKRF